MPRKASSLSRSTAIISRMVAATMLTAFTCPVKRNLGALQRKWIYSIIEYS